MQSRLAALEWMQAVAPRRTIRMQHLLSSLLRCKRCGHSFTTIRDRRWPGTSSSPDRKSSAQVAPQRCRVNPEILNCLDSVLQAPGLLESIEQLPSLRKPSDTADKIDGRLHWMRCWLGGRQTPPHRTF